MYINISFIVLITIMTIIIPDAAGLIHRIFFGDIISTGYHHVACKAVNDIAYC